MSFMDLALLHSVCKAKEQRRYGIRKRRTDELCDKKGGVERKGASTRKGKTKGRKKEKEEKVERRKGVEEEENKSLQAPNHNCITRPRQVSADVGARFQPARRELLH